VRRNLSETMFRPQSAGAQRIGTRRIMQRASRSPARLSSGDMERVRKATVRAVPLHVKAGSKVEVQVEVRPKR